MALEFANTSYARRGEPQEGIGNARHLAAWLAEHADQLTTKPPARLTESDTARFRALRDAIRALGAAVVDGEPTPAGAVEEINQAAAAAPHWPQLNGFTATTHTAASPADSVRAEIASDAIRVFSGPGRELLRRCHGPGCILYFVKDHPRREWCSPACGTRARVARHYQRHKEG